MGVSYFNSHDIDYPNILPNPLEEVDTSFKYIGQQIVVPFNNRLFFCSNYKGDKCYSYDLKTGKKETHDPMNTKYNIYWYFSSVKVNKKIWVHGGWNVIHSLSESHFLLPNLTWISGPDLPEAKILHSSVAIDEMRVVIFGGMNVNKIWIYNDKFKTYEHKKPRHVGYGLSACLLSNFREVANNIILVRDNFSRMQTYDWTLDIWTKLDLTWTIPKIYDYVGVLLQIRQR